MSSYIVEGKTALAFGSVAAAGGDQAREAAISFAVCSQEDYRRRIAGSDFGTDEKFELHLFDGAVGADDAGQTVAIGDGERLVAQFGGAAGEFVRMRSAFQE